MKLNELEKTVLRFMFESCGVLNPAVSEILDQDFEMERNYSGIGFLTDIQPAQVLKLWDEGVSMRWSNVGAYLNKERLDTGYLIYVDDGYLTGIEGFTYGGDLWPDLVNEIEVYKELFGKSEVVD
jgi:hypothetical protein